MSAIQPSPTLLAAPAVSQSRQRSLIGAAISHGLLTVLAALVAQPQAAQATPVLAEGQYLYGQTQQANVPGQTYLLLQVQQDRVVGAFYQPASAFDCVHGAIGSSALELAVVDSYEQTSSAYRLALRSEATLSAGTSAAGPVQVEGFYPIATLSQGDQAILQTCLADHPL